MSSDYIQGELDLDFGGPASPVSEWEEALWADGAIIDQLSEERKRQVEKWGEQNHPYFSVFSSADREDSARTDYARSAKSAKHWNDHYVKTQTLGWDTILLEEVWEALELAGVDDVGYEEELIQVMAVCAAMIEANQRKRRKQNG